MAEEASVQWLAHGEKIILLWLLLLDASRLISGGTNERPAITLEDILPTDYDNFQTPKSAGKPADVSVRIEILNIRSVDVSDMSFIADIFLYKTWNDGRLRFPTNKTDKIALNPDWRKHLWTPDIYFHNAIAGKVQDTIIPYVYLWLKNDSTVMFGARLSLQLSCDMVLQDFPHDTQTCDIIIKSLTHTLNEMNLHWGAKNPLVVGDIILLPQFDHHTPIAENCSKPKDEKPLQEKFACLRGILKLTRRVGYYVINIYIPTILIVFMSMLTFWMPPDAVPARVTLGVTSLLTIITKQYQASLPNVSYVVALNVWLSCCIGFVFCSLMEYAAVIALLAHQKRKKAEAVPAVENVHAASDQAIHFGKRAQDKLMTWLESLNCHNIDRFSRVLFPLFFGIQCMIYWGHYAR